MKADFSLDFDENDFRNDGPYGPCGPNWFIYLGKQTF